MGIRSLAGKSEQNVDAQGTVCASLCTHTHTLHTCMFDKDLNLKGLKKSR